MTTWFIAECVGNDGKSFEVMVTRERNTIYTRVAGMGAFECHPSVKTEDQVRAEIELRYDCKVTKIRYPSEDAAALRALMNQSASDLGQ